MKALLKKWNEIVDDYEANVTRIWMRREVHMCMDVMAHSVISFPFMGVEVTRGWVEILIAGDTRTGKSEVAGRLAKHIGMARPIDCERASMPGIVGGIDKQGDRNTIVWGAVPRNDRRAVVLDETTGLTEEQISSMSSIRSSGVAAITKIHAEQTMARVRKLWLANPRTDRNRKMGSYTFGVTCIPEIIGRAEDIARFDLALCLSSDTVPLEVLNSATPPVREHRYTTEAAKALLYWAWTRKPQHVVWENGAEAAVLDVASRQCETYHTDIPLVEQGEQRLRVARVAVALAARFCSTDAAFEKLIVKRRHVELADWFFDTVYSDYTTGYKEWSQQRKIQTRPPVSEDVKKFEADIASAVWWPEARNQLLSGCTIQELTNVDYAAAPRLSNALLMARFSDDGRTANQYFRKTYSGRA